MLVIGILNFALVALFSGCSSSPLPPAPAAAAATPSSSGTQLIDAGFEVKTTTVVGVIESIDVAQRKLQVKRPDGSSKRYKAGKEVTNFDQLKVGDEVVATVTDACAIFLVKGGVLPGVAAGGVFARNPKGTSPGGVALDTLDYNAKILDVDREMRQVLLQYGTNQAETVTLGPNINLAEVNVNDDVLVRATEAMAIVVEGNPK